MLKILSILNPSADPAGALAMAAMARAAEAFEAHVVMPSSAGSPAGDGFVHALSVRGRSRLLRYDGLRRVVRALQPDVIHVQARAGSVLALQAARQARQGPGAALVLDVRHAWPMVPIGIGSIIQRRVLSRTAAAIGPNHYTLRQLTKAGLKGSGFLCGLYLPPSIPAERERQAARAMFGLPAGTLVVGAWGALRIGSGIVDVLEAVAASQQPVVLLAHGDGPLRDELSDRAAALGASARLRIIDQPVPRGGAFLAALDCLIVMPQPRFSDSEPFNVRIARALAHGVPVIASSSGGLNEMMGAGGWVMDPSDPGQLAGLLQRLANEPAELARLAASAQAEASRRFTAEAVLGMMTQAFEAAYAARSAQLRSPRRVQLSQTAPGGRA